MKKSGLERKRFEQAFSSRDVPDSFEKLKNRTVAIAGVGGLGSNAAAALVRAGVGSLIIADPDRVEISNLNRQFYFQDQIGQMKVEALTINLTNINPYVNIVSHGEKLTPFNLIEKMGDAEILVEALDKAEDKAWLIQSWLSQKPGHYVVGASGLAGCGQTELLKKRRLGNLILWGDGVSDQSLGLSAGKVCAVASLQADSVLEILLSS